MTTQFPDKLINDHPRVKFDGLRLYRVIRGDIHTRHGWGDGVAFATQPSPPASAPRCSALWRGYVATFRLDEDGGLELLSFDYMLGFGRWKTEQVHERLTGDFWLVMKPEFTGPRTYVPFRDGRIVEDRTAWFTEEPFEVRVQRRRAKDQEGS